MTQVSNYPKEVQEAIKMAQVMDRNSLVNYFDSKIEEYSKKAKEDRYSSWAKDYARIYFDKKKQVLEEFDKHGIACWHIDYNHYGHGFDCEDIDVYLYTDGTYKVAYHSYSAY